MQEIINMIRGRKDGRMLAAFLDECSFNLKRSVTCDWQLEIIAPCQAYRDVLFHMPYGMCIDWAFRKKYREKCRVSLVLSHGVIVDIPLHGEEK